MPFQKASKQQKYLNMCLYGPAGSGKTWTALEIAKAMGKSIAVIDTERSSAALYATDFEFDTCNLNRYSVDDYVNLINEAVAGGYDFLIIDSLSHAWEGTGGILERVEEIDKQKKYRGGMKAWNDVKPEENKLWDTILSSPIHIICTMRSKTDYETVEKNGRKVMERVGMAPIQRSGREYEFDVVGAMDIDNAMSIEKTRCSSISGKLFKKPGAEFANILAEWCGSGEERQPSVKQVLDEIAVIVRDNELDAEKVKGDYAKVYGKEIGSTTVEEALEWKGNVEDNLDEYAVRQHKETE
jgi:hypothetical protein